MRIVSFLLFFCVVGFVCYLVQKCEAKDLVVENGVDVLENLKRFDSIYQSGFSVSGTVKGKEAVFLNMHLMIERRWKLSFEGDRVGYLMDVIDYEKPQYKAQQRLPTRRNPVPDENMRVLLKAKKWGYWGQDISGWNYEETVLTVSPSGEVVDTGRGKSRSLVFTPRDEDILSSQRVFLWSLGRFFSEHLDKVTKMEPSSDGRLFVSVIGRKGKEKSGRWELEIEPAAAWMVRSARFYWDSYPNSIDAEMKNEGTVWSGPYCIPKYATIDYWGQIDGFEAGQLPFPTTSRFTFEPTVEKFDERLYASTKQAVAQNQTPSLTVFDFRTNPLTVTEPFRKGGIQPIPTKSSKAKIMLIVNGIGLFLILLALAIRWYKIRYRR